jgi:hypothetical protein
MAKPKRQKKEQCCDHKEIQKFIASVITTSKKGKNQGYSCCKVKNVNSSVGGLYCFGFLGAVVYYISTATSFGMGILGFLKAIVWPAFLIFEVMKFLGM